MAARYKDLRVLVVDDFNSFRITLNKILYDIGFRKIDSVGTGEEALVLCDQHRFDLIFCDYNLGKGKNGQQLLEELRLKKLLKPQDIFILLSAETSRYVVMSAFDCEPDAYLTKPITSKVIDQRVKRLLSRRSELLSIYNSMVAGDTKSTVEQLQNIIKKNSRYSMDCQKLLAETYMKENLLKEAEQVYRAVLEVRALDWAQVGLANIKIAQGDYQTAAKWLEEIIDATPNCLKAYDALVIALEALNNEEKLQKVKEKAVEVSPMSIGRQVSLAKTAMDNGDSEVAAKAYRKTVKFGINSHYNTAENKLSYAKAVTRYYDDDADKAEDMAKEAVQLINQMDDEFLMDSELKVKSQLLGSQLWALQGEVNKADAILEEVNDTLSHKAYVDIDIEIELVNALVAKHDTDKAQKKIQDLIEKYKGDQSSLEKIDPLLLEPVSEKGKKDLAAANKKGIEAYKTRNYDAAMEFFDRVEKRYPRYIGIKLNLVQAIIGKIRAEGVSEELINRCIAMFDMVESFIDANSTHYDRYRQLKDMLRQVSSAT